MKDDDEAVVTNEDTESGANKIDKSLLSDLIKEHNKLADEATAVGLTGYKSVSSFPGKTAQKQIEAGKKRVQALRSSITAYTKGHPAEAEPSEGKTGKMRKSATKTKAKTNNNKKAVKEPKHKSYVPGSPCRLDDLMEFTLGGRTDGTNKSIVLDLLIKNFRKPVSITKLNQACYKKNEGPIAPVLGGLKEKLVEKKLPYEIATDTEGKETAYVLQPKSKK